MLVALFLVLMGALYYVLYDLLLHQRSSGAKAVLWAAVTILPWLSAFEANKLVLYRAGTAFGRAAGIAAIMLTTLILSGFVQWLFLMPPGSSIWSVLPLHMISDLPKVIIVTLLTVITAFLSFGRTEESSTAIGALPANPADILWVKAAGNYVEFRTDARCHIHRMTLQGAQALLPSGQFVRISRSVVVNRNAVASNTLAKGEHIRLTDGSLHKVGNAYRADAASLV
ncbi:LytTR family transcriptional regulator [Allosphingosinicella flava]|uniref:LytTR family transcriptional regulator n=1 Tax=Allosphingosinicella flava TaxID=2771430 RepID=A0A7T2LMT4_9SPHN|nr:LytTR family transcriptional regulator [Sphingosinicella flava]